MAYTATLSNGVYHRGGEFDGNIDFHIVFEPEVPLAAVLDNLRVSRPGEPCPLEILAYAESGGGFDLTVFDEFFPMKRARLLKSLGEISHSAHWTWSLTSVKKVKARRPATPLAVARPLFCWGPASSDSLRNT